MLRENSESKITTPSTSPMQRLSTTGNISSEMCSVLRHLAFADDLIIPSFLSIFSLCLWPQKRLLPTVI